MAGEFESTSARASSWARWATSPTTRRRSSPFSRASSTSRCWSRGWGRQDGAAKAVSRATGRRLIRLQCEGLDEAKALYEWNYRKQLLRIQTEASGTGWEQVPEDIFGEEFLLPQPPQRDRGRRAGRAPDRRDRQDRPRFEPCCSRSVRFPDLDSELGVVEARTQPLVLLTSNNSRELTEALKRRCLYLWLDYPDVERELEIVHLHAPELDQGIARKLVEVIHMVRQLDLKSRPRSRVDRLGAGAAAARRRGRRPRRAREDDVDHRQAPDRSRPRGRARRGEVGDGIVGTTRQAG